MRNIHGNPEIIQWFLSASVEGNCPIALIHKSRNIIRCSNHSYKLCQCARSCITRKSELRDTDKLFYTRHGRLSSRQIRNGKIIRFRRSYAESDANDIPSWHRKLGACFFASFTFWIIDFSHTNRNDDPPCLFHFGSPSNVHNDWLNSMHTECPISSPRFRGALICKLSRGSTSIKKDKMVRKGHLQSIDAVCGMRWKVVISRVRILSCHFKGMFNIEFKKRYYQTIDRAPHACRFQVLKGAE
jgi:hypothetical protein